jgi:hypothetical protein
MFNVTIRIPLTKDTSKGYDFDLSKLTSQQQLDVIYHGLKQLGNDTTGKKYGDEAFTAFVEKLNEVQAGKWSPETRGGKSDEVGDELVAMLWAFAKKAGWKRKAFDALYEKPEASHETVSSAVNVPSEQWQVMLTTAANIVKARNDAANLTA